MTTRLDLPMPEGKSARLPRLRVLCAPNPSPMTGPGTNSFLIGSGRVALIDPGPDDDRHLGALLAALDPDEQISDILVTHPHLDHSALAPRLAAATGAPVWAFGPAGSGRSPAMDRLVRQGLTGGAEGVDRAFSPDRHLTDGSVVSGPDWQLCALHTPGHMGEHLCFALKDVLFTGDHVMGWAPSLISPPEGSMGDYLTSLTRLAVTPWRLFLPAHGASVPDPAARLAALTAHRRNREAQILAALTEQDQTLAAITARAYAGTDPALMQAASRNALAHLIDLAEKALVTATPYPNPSATFRRP